MPPKFSKPIRTDHSASADQTPGHLVVFVTRGAKGRAVDVPNFRTDASHVTNPILKTALGLLKMLFMPILIQFELTIFVLPNVLLRFSESSQE